MSTPDARLNAAERAALADMEAAAAAADPALAKRLRGGRTSPAFGSARLRFLRVWLTVLRAQHLAAPFIVLGLLLIVLGMSGGLAVSLAGVAILVVGMRIGVEMISDLYTRRRD